MTPPKIPGGLPRGSTEQSGDRDGNRQLWAAADDGWVLAVQLISGVFTWGGIGWLLDRWLGTAPWLLVAGFTLGWGTGIYLAWLKFGRGDSPKGDPGGPDEEGSVSAGDAGT